MAPAAVKVKGAVERAAYVPPRKGELEFTSAWSNFYNGRDHTSAAMAAESEK